MAAGLAACVLGLAGAAHAVPVETRVRYAATATDSALLAAREAIVSAGGRINGFAAGNVFSVTIDTADLSRLRALAGVIEVKVFAPVAGAAAPATSQLFGLGLRLPDPAEEAAAQDAWRLRDLQTAKVNTIAPNRLSLLRTLVGSTGTGPLATGSGLPSRADNSLSPHFPPIGDQEGRASCVAWAICYYFASYTHALDENLDLSGSWLPRLPDCFIARIQPPVGAFVMRCAGQPDCPVSSPDPAHPGQHTWDGAKFDACNRTVLPPRPSAGTQHIASPAFLYPLINNGADRGVRTYLIPDALARLNDIGCASWDSKPYDPWQFDTVSLRWPTEAQWIEALKRRTAAVAGSTLGVLQFDLNRAGQLDLLKQHLANGQIAVTAGIVHQNWFTFGVDPHCPAKGSCPGVDNDVLFSDGGTQLGGGHAVTIVGYDDDKTWVDNRGVTHRGALLIANSAGPGFGTFNSVGSTANPGPDPARRGFIWIAYDYVTAGLSFGSSPYFWRVWAANDRPAYRPRLLAFGRLAKAQRADIDLRGHVGLVTVPLFTSHTLLPGGFDDAINPMDAGERVVLDLTDGAAVVDRRAAVPPLMLRLAPSFGTGAGATLSDVEWHWDATGSGNFVRLAAPDAARTASRSRSVTACTAIAKTGDVNGDGRTSLADVNSIVGVMPREGACVGDPRDIDGAGRIDVFDARRAAVLCSQPGCR